MRSDSKTQPEAVLVTGGRIPFRRAMTDYKDLRAYDLARMALEGLIGRSGLNLESLDFVIMGTVIQDVDTSNIAREAALAAGIPDDIPAFTTTMACISSNVAVTSAMDKILSGSARSIITGGVDTMSDAPIRLKRRLRMRLMEAQKARSAKDWANIMKGFRPSELVPIPPSVTEFSTGITMGESCDRMTAKYGVTREEQDKYALQSHKRAGEATRNGWLDPELFPVDLPPDHELIRHDNTFRDDSTLEKMAKLRPAFGGKYGTITAGNASPLTDGASACLIMDRTLAQEEGFQPLARLRSYSYVGQQPDDELLIGPAVAVPRLLDKEGLTLDDIDVFEFHEAFAGQILTVLKALDSDRFAKERLGRDRKVGEIPMDRFNCWGGSLSLGHPFGATGVRLLTTAANRLHKEDGELALIAACAAGGLGHAILLERI